MANANDTAAPGANVNVHFYVYEKVIMMSVLVILSVTGTIGNFLTCVIFCQNKSLRTPANYFILSLAVADVLQSLNMVFIMISIMSNGWVLGYGLCQLCGWTNMSFIITSVMNLALISLNRYFAVIKKNSQLMFKKKNALLLIAFSWVYPALFSIAPIYGWAKYEYRPGKLICTLQFSESISYTLTLMCFAIFTPFAIMCYSTYKILKEVRLSRTRIACSTGVAQQRRKYETRISIMLTSIIVFFFIFYSPSSIVNLIQLGIGNDYTTPYRIDAWSVIMAMFNHANNPIIYCILNPNFRRGLKGLCSLEKRNKMHRAAVAAAAAHPEDDDDNPHQTSERKPSTPTENC